MTNEEQIAFIRKNIVSIGCGALSLLLAAGLYFRSDALTEAEAELAAKTTEATRLATNLKYAAQLKEQLDALVAAGREIDAKIVRASQVGTNTQYFYKLESETGVKLVDFRPLNPVPPPKGAKPVFTPVGFTVSVQGTYAQLVNFMKLLEGGPHYARVLTAMVSSVPANRKAPLTLALNLELLGTP